MQGQFAIYKDGDNLRILAPDLDDHVYLAGPWLAEMTIPKNTPLELVGATGSCPPPENKPSLIMGVGTVKPEPSRARLDISAPWPKAAHAGLREVNDESVLVTVDGKEVPQPPSPAVVVILEYDCQYGPYLSPVSGNQPIQWPAVGGQYQAIHVYATGERESAEQEYGHATEAFVKAARLLGVDAKIEWDPYTLPPNRISVNPPLD